MKINIGYSEFRCCAVQEVKLLISRLYLPAINRKPICNIEPFCSVSRAFR